MCVPTIGEYLDRRLSPPEQLLQSLHMLQLSWNDQFDQRIASEHNNGQQWTTMDTTGQYWTTMDNNRQQMTTMDNN